jgi:hypothetical protein
MLVEKALETPFSPSWFNTDSSPATDDDITFHPTLTLETQDNLIGGIQRRHTLPSIPV